MSFSENRSIYTVFVVPFLESLTIDDMNYIATFVLILGVAFAFEHVGRIYNTPVIRPTTYINYFTDFAKWAWHQAGVFAASVASFVYEIIKNLKKYLKEIGVTLEEVFNSICRLLQTPKEFFVGFYERARDFIWEYIGIFTIILGICCAITGFYFRTQIQDFVARHEQKIGVAAFLIVLLIAYYVLAALFQTSENPVDAENAANRPENPVRVRRSMINE